ncbi:SDR family NAD(P)-dependent oxidoreductase [Rhizobium mongolense]|uniref:NAD(P)-dependent dehydrogenase (Short-subunit alcohol dehydrogenase family) n=2 Tax=Rhizobium mongolense TaxID=57676 RepID=A0ABR6IF96_9HYPH|nr:SDR family NAD(P)-dependent oxidoreductase [Rhizobium mongolense]MBB4226323.1 NAD(P)-dependent dehydrogenase (short-subunit alcohol dehydrogenase family) [Rhizobium mongolense]TVZ73605.1 NAD(P)-dependent dehydrogenase (short-subunit alcohol dehydrogenase family) [Rhizobium mongolense USDA 1844]
MTDTIISDTMVLPRRDILTGMLVAGATVGTGFAAQPAAAQTPGVLQGKVAIVTGGTSGIGAVTAGVLAQAGAKVAFNGRREALGHEVEGRIRANGGEVVYIKSDVRDARQVERFVAETVERYGRLDIAFNNAGIDLPPAPIADTDIAGFDDQIATNLRGVFVAMKYELPHLVRSEGVMINMASIGGRHAFPNIVAYGASKAAVIHMTRAAAQEYGRHVRINAIAPGAIETPMLERVRRDWKVTTEQLVGPYPMRRAGTSEEVASLVVFLASDASSYISGHVIGIDGGDLA